MTYSFIRLQVLYDGFHFVAAHWLGTSVEAYILKELHPSPDPFVMRPECIIGLIRTKLTLRPLATAVSLLGHQI